MIKQLLIALTLLILIATNSITLATNARDENTGDCIRQGKCKD